jgi:putative hydrolase of the HAD superfamily
MAQKIQAIFLDTGNTMRVVVQDAVFQYRARQELAKLVRTNESPDIFCEKLTKRYETYKAWTRETLLQASELELWTRWMLPDSDAVTITPLVSRLTRLWLDQSGHRVPRKDVKQTIIELHQRGYILGIIANTITQTEIPEWLEHDGLIQYFKAIILSSKIGRRKPDPFIYLEAARAAGVNPANCAYVGDNPSRDISGARQAGFTKVLILLEQATLMKEPPQGHQKPDGIISEFNDLLQFFPSHTTD